ncbi:hypothetical protein DL240_13140 [Lujinxingia litoralis]|uniref:DUF429 domain-containing protein n=1 Tax=Lujinxingia litoralis TaxID=2211119 RepID=A0A328C664_9DELT|nr:hypothetical protein [Lujinxingia litoralis]RAL21791.1 hypothetical protein DL240_13140 [Lujinxingia litoralis]
MREFERIIGIDWAGAGRDDQRVGLRIVEAAAGQPAREVRPPGTRARNWKRVEVFDYLRELLRPDAPRTLVGIDASLGYPVGAASEVFGVESWRALVARIAAMRRDAPTLDAFLDRVNMPFAEEVGVPLYSRDREGRAWDRPHHSPGEFYSARGVAYWRMVELFLPQSLSAFYMGPGPMVAGHTLTCLAMLDALLTLRDAGELDVSVWPQEGGLSGTHHVIAECYPSMLPRDTTIQDKDLRDAQAIAVWLLEQSQRGTLDGFLKEVERVPKKVAQVIAEEGWVLGVRLPKQAPALLGCWPHTEDGEVS